jgi:hypothetical protein
MRRIVAVLLVSAAGCETSPFPDSMTPTQLQQRQFDAGGQSMPYYDLNDGDNEDPCFDNAAYPNMSQPWWNSPGYEGG